MSGTAVLDLDGVLADVAHRLHHVRGRRRDWDAFFAAAGEDPVLPEGAAVAAELVARGHPLVYCSGRPERLRATTLAWLQEHGLPPGRLLLRPDGDRRPARVLKLELLRRLAAEEHLVLLVDDDEDVVRTVRAARPPVVDEVLLADWAQAAGRRSPALHRAQEDEGRT